MGLLVKKSEGQDTCIVGYVDVDYAGDIDTRKLLIGYAFQVCGCTASWKANLQHVVALSTTESNYMAITKAFKEVLWLKGLLNELGVKQKTVEVFSDSQSAIYLTKN